jgi:uncharacterized protein YaeQ
MDSPANAICLPHFSYVAPQLNHMAIKATIFKADLQVADIDRGYYAGHALTMARHPSETDERMMVRLLAFALNAHAALAFGRGLSAEDEPDLWQRDLTGAIELWIDVGLPDEKELRRACGRADRVVVYAYGSGVDVWWGQNGDRLKRNRNLRVFKLPSSTTRELARLARRNMNIQATIHDGQISLADENEIVPVEVTILKA